MRVPDEVVKSDSLVNYIHREIYVVIELVRTLSPHVAP